MLLPISRQLLIEYGGSDNESIKAFFTLYTDIQASATCLVLACSKAIQDQQIAEWATRAFLLYGGEPKLLFPPQQQQHINRGAGLPQGMQVGMSVAPNMMNAMQTLSSLSELGSKFIRMLSSSFMVLVLA